VVVDSEKQSNKRKRWQTSTHKFGEEMNPSVKNSFFFWAQNKTLSLLLLRLSYLPWLTHSTSPH